jgi:hypothetical protein
MLLMIIIIINKCNKEQVFISRVVSGAHYGRIANVVFAFVEHITTFIQLKELAITEIICKQVGGVPQGENAHR